MLTRGAIFLKRTNVVGHNDESLKILFVNIIVSSRSLLYNRTLKIKASRNGLRGIVQIRDL